MSFKKVGSYSRLFTLLMSIDMTPGFKPFNAVLPKYANKTQWTVYSETWTFTMIYCGSFKVELY